VIVNLTMNHHHSSLGEVLCMYYLTDKLTFTEHLRLLRPGGRLVLVSRETWIMWYGSQLEANLGVKAGRLGCSSLINVHG
jgi:hypothetical protein